MNKTCALLCYVFVLAVLLTQQSLHAEDAPAKIRIVLVGDSTVTDNAGWGAGFAKLLNDKAECLNHAKGGASSKNYYTGGLWKRALATKPAYVLIQFGHNDQPGKGPQRETDPATTYRDQLRTYVEEARAAGAKPILVTSMVRRIFSADSKINSNLAPYADAVKAVAAELKVPVVDLHARSKELVEKLGPEKANELGPKHPTLEGKFDGTHLNEKGAAAIAPLVANELRQALPELKAFFR